MGGQLILIRHGIAEERTPEGDDFYRKLTEVVPKILWKLL